MSQLVDFLMIGMMGLGGVFIFFNWDQVEAFLKGGGSCSGTSGNCTYNKCKDGRTDADYCWHGGGSTGTSCVKVPIGDPDNEQTSKGCTAARTRFCSQSPTNCGSTPGGSGTSGNCTYNVPKGQFTWKGTYQACQNGKTVILQNSKSINCPGCSQPKGCDTVRTSWLQTFHNTPCAGGGKTCTGGFVPCTGGCCCNRDIKKCGAGQISVIVGTGSAATCGCYNCNQGFHRVNNTCVANTGGNVTACGIQGNGGQAWIARVATAMLGRMCNSCGKNPSITQILQGWPSLTQQCALENQCNTNKLHFTYAPFNKHFAQLLLAIRSAYGIPISAAASTALSNMQTSGLWALNIWMGGVPGYLARADINTGYGMAYSATLAGRENTWDPYGDQRYSFTLPKEGMKVKVSN